MIMIRFLTKLLLLTCGLEFVFNNTGTTNSSIDCIPTSEVFYHVIIPLNR